MRALVATLFSSRTKAGDEGVLSTGDGVHGGRAF